MSDVDDIRHALTETFIEREDWDEAVEHALAGLARFEIYAEEGWRLAKVGEERLAERDGLLDAAKERLQLLEAALEFAKTGHRDLAQMIAALSRRSRLQDTALDRLQAWLGQGHASRSDAWAQELIRNTQEEARASVLAASGSVHPALRAAELHARAAALVEYGNSLPDGVTTEAFAEAANLRREAQALLEGTGEEPRRGIAPTFTVDDDPRDPIPGSRDKGWF